MKKVLGIMLLCVFALSFIGGIAISDADANNKPITRCTIDCIYGTEYICCQIGRSDNWDCYWGGPC